MSLNCCQPVTAGRRDGFQRGVRSNLARHGLEAPRIKLDDRPPPIPLLRPVHPLFVSIPFSPPLASILSAARLFPSFLPFCRSPECSHNSLIRKNFEHPAMFTYTPSTPEFEPVSPCFEDRTHPASMAPCGIHNPALLEFIRTDVSRELVCKSQSSARVTIRVEAHTYVIRLSRRKDHISHWSSHQGCCSLHPARYSHQGMRRRNPRSPVSRNFCCRGLRAIQCAGINPPCYARIP